MIVRSALAGLLLSGFVMQAKADALFDVGIDAKWAGPSLEVRPTITNRSAHPVCFPIFQSAVPAIFFRGLQGTPFTPAPSWGGGSSAPSPVQVVPADGISRSYMMTKISQVYRDHDPQEASVVMTIALFDCASFFSGKKFVPREVFRKTVTVPVPQTIP